MQRIFMTFAALVLLAAPTHAAMTEAEAQAINSGVPRDCSLVVVPQKNAECVDFNKALLLCQSAGFGPGLQLKACMVKKGKIRRQ